MAAAQAVLDAADWLDTTHPNARPVPDWALETLQAAVAGQNREAKDRLWHFTGSLEPTTSATWSPCTETYDGGFEEHCAQCDRPSPPGGMKPAALRQWRTNRGLTVPQLAEALGVTRATVYRWESGVRQMPRWAELRLTTL